MSGIGDVQGHQRVAALLLSLGKEERAAIMRKMKPDAVALVADAMLELDPRLTEVGVLDELLAELAREVHGPGTIRPCRAEDLQDLLGTSFGPQRAQEILNEIDERRREKRPFVALEAYRPHEIARVLRGEAPAVAALVLAHLDPAMSAEVLRSFEDEAAVDVVRRMATLEPPSDQRARDDREGPGRGSSPRRAAVRADSGSDIERLKVVANLLNNSTPEMEKGVIESIAAERTRRWPRSCASTCSPGTTSAPSTVAPCRRSWARWTPRPSRSP